MAYPTADFEGSMGISLRNRISILRRDGYRCIYCGQTSRDTRLHVDHVIPRSRGGASDWSNLVTACITCNLGKSNMDLPLPDGFVPSEPLGWHGRQPRDRRRIFASASDEPDRTDPLQSGSLGYCTDACPACARLAAVDRHATARMSGCFACLPMSLWAGAKDGFVMGYRCAHDHEWRTSWDRDEAFSHSAVSFAELKNTGQPCFPLLP